MEIMDGDDALADQILEQFQFGEYNNGGDLLAAPAPVTTTSPSAPIPSDIFNVGLGNLIDEPRQGEVVSCELVDLLMLENDLADRGRDRLGMMIPDDVNQFPAFPDKPWMPEIKDEPLEGRMPPPVRPPMTLHPVVAKPTHHMHHHKRQPHHHFGHDRVQEPFNWSRIHDPIRRKKIERWKQKRDRIRSGLTVKHVYDVRVQHAIKRPRTGGRFVSAAAQNAMRETSSESRHEQTTTSTTA